MKRSMRQLAWQWVLMGALLMGGGATSAWAQNTFPASGNVGIGTTSPNNSLHVKRSDGNVLTQFETSLANANGWIQVANPAHSYLIGLRGDTANNFTIFDNTMLADRFSITSAGNVGIGTTSPNNSLHVKRSDGNVLTQFETSLANANGWIQVANPAHSYLIGLRGDTANNFTIFDNTMLADRFSITSAGNVGIGTTNPTTKLHVVGDAQVDGNLAAKYQDVAEWVQTPSPLPPGTVVVVDPQGRNQVLSASQSYDTRVAGVVSARPGLLLGEAGPDKVKVAQSGRVKVKVDASYGPITAGDLLVTSLTPGHAMRSTPLNLGGAIIHRPGTLLGKALEPLEEGQGEILVLLTIQ